MKKTITNYKIDAFFNYVTQSGVIEKKGLPMKLLWAINRNMSALGEIERDYQTLKKNIANEYLSDDKSDVLYDEAKNPVVDSNGNEIRKVKKEFIAEYSSRLDELNNIENEVDVHTIGIEQIEDIDFFALSDVMILDFMIVENDNLK